MDTTPGTAGSEAPRAEAPAGQVVASAAAPSTAASTSSDPFAASVRSHISARAAAILLCSGAPVAIEASWDPSRSTTVALSARGVSDAAIGECIGTAIGSIAVPFSATPGRLVHPVTN